MELHYLSRQERQFYGSLLASVNDRTHEQLAKFPAHADRDHYAATEGRIGRRSRLL
jgi:hypothetical protein